MSDEFNVENRSFTDGHDPLWTALDRSDDDASEAGGGSMQFYNSSAVTTTEGMLKISTYLETTEWNHYDHVKKEWKHIRKNFTSGMMQSWNKFCFTGGIVEVDIIFPGQPFIGGLWPAVWMLGNLGRATYEASTNMIWPWSFDKCDRTLQPAQTISACNRENHYGMHSYQGRGATEIDIVEAMMGESNGPLPNTKPPISLPYADFTLQVREKALQPCARFLRDKYSLFDCLTRSHRACRTIAHKVGRYHFGKTSFPKTDTRSFLRRRGTMGSKCMETPRSILSFMERTWTRQNLENP